MPRVAEIYIARDKAMPMEYQAMVRAIEGVGLEGENFRDRYATGQGAFSNTKEDKIRHVTLISQEDIDVANSGLEEPFLPYETRRNIVIEGIPSERLLGVRFEIGHVLLEGVSICDPCVRPEKLAGKSGFKSGFAGSLGGIRAAILSTGLIFPKDRIFY